MLKMGNRTVPAEKEKWLSFFRGEANVLLLRLQRSGKASKDKASLFNGLMRMSRDSQISQVLERAQKEQWEKAALLNEILLLTYAFYVAMLEGRNDLWAYDYMAFSRRIGELWEPFCKFPFMYPLRSLSLIEPPSFREVQSRLQQDAVTYIDSLELRDEIKEELKRHYAIPWTMVDSGGIKLCLDLHFEQDGIRYHCDFKSGFGSNEKGNTNRLLLVASIYRSLGNSERTLLFVRQREDENNHYLQTLKTSPYWDVFCADECYDAIRQFTGFNIRRWLDENVRWTDDINAKFRRHLWENNLLKYLTW